jgi:hypothetical protein
VHRWILAALVASVLAACATHGPVLSPELPDGREASGVELVDTVFFPQEDYRCGPAALATSLQRAGVKVSPQELTDKVYLPSRQGSLQFELIAATSRYGQVPYVLEPDIGQLLAELNAGHPVIVLQNLGLSFAPVWHYAVVIGYLPKDDAIVLRSGTQHRRVMAAGAFRRSWEAAGGWAMVVLPPGEMPARPEATKYLSAVAGLEQAGQFDAAMRGYRSAAERWPALPTVWLGLGNAEYQLRRLDLAEATFRKLSTSHPKDATARNNLALVLAERGCYAEAERQLETALVAGAPSPSIRQQLLQSRDEIAAMKSSGDATATGLVCQ